MLVAPPCGVTWDAIFPNSPGIKAAANPCPSSRVQPLGHNSLLMNCTGTHKQFMVGSRWFHRDLPEVFSAGRSDQ